MEKVQIWKPNKNLFYSDNVTEELFCDDKFQSVYYTLKNAEAITITPEPFSVSVLIYVLEGKLHIHAKGFDNLLEANNSALLTDVEKSYMVEAMCFSKIIVITSSNAQNVDNSDHYLNMLEAAERKDKGTWGHGRRVGKIAVRIAQEYDASYDLIPLGQAGTLHDIGKINTPAEILLKPGKLTPEEFKIIERHPVDSYKLLVEHYGDCVALPAFQHHERLDGSGYPYGLQGDEICINARIIAISDVFDAMTSIRSYHEAAQDEYALQYIESHPQSYDMRFVKILRKLVENKTIDYIRNLLM